MIARITAILAFAALFAPLPAHAQKFEAGSVYICPNNSETGLDCYLDAVVHLYTMCRHVKSIEIIEFGYEQSQEGTNGAKSESCVDKQKLNMTRVYQAALRDAKVSAQAVDMVRGLHDYWLDSLSKLRWLAGESDDDYKRRTTAVYETLDERINGIRTLVAVGSERVAQPAPAPRRDSRRTKPAP